MLPGLEEKLARFQEAGLEDRLREQSLLVREERLLESIPERLQPFYECLDLLLQALPIDRAYFCHQRHFKTYQVGKSLLVPTRF